MQWMAFVTEYIMRVGSLHTTETKQNKIQRIGMGE